MLAFAGPFLVEVVDVKEAVPYATAILTLKVAASGLSPIVLNELERGNPDAFSVTDVLDAKGHSLVDTESAASSGRLGSAIRGSMQRTTRVALKACCATSRPSRRCDVSCAFPYRPGSRRSASIPWPPARPGKLGDLDFTLQAATKGQATLQRR